MRPASVIGTGAIGTSVALALTRLGVSVHLDDVDRTAARKPGCAQADFATVWVAISDQPGALAGLFAAVGEIGVNVEDIRIEHSLGRPLGLVELFVQQNSAAELSRLLRVGGWAVSDWPEKTVPAAA